MLAPMKTEEPHIYQMQVQDKSCTICRHVGEGGTICQICFANNRCNWENAFKRKR